MRNTVTPTALLLLVVVACCDGGSPTAAGAKDPGRRIVEALAKARGDEPTRAVPAGPRVPIDLSKTVIGTDTWSSIGDPDLAKAIGEYAKGAFPGETFDCPMGPRGAGCFPLARDDLPRDGLLMFVRTPWDPPNTVSVVHYVFVSVEEAMAARRARGLDDSVTNTYPARYPDGWILDRMLYSVDVNRLPDGGWSVGRGRDECCI